jgi:DNA-binding NtrC family response regulator
VALLRVLQDRTFERVGGTTALRADVRIVCATHRDLPAMVQRGEFREDLYYRLRGVVLEVPPLRDRLDDLPFMADAILERLAAERGAVPKRIAPAALDALARHTWPGNVRELDNALRAAALFAEGPVIQLHDLTSNVGGLSQLASAGATSARSANVAISDRANAEGECVGPATLDSRGQQARGSVGTDDAFDDCAMSHSSKIAQFTSGTGGSALEVAYAAIRAGISLSDLKRDIERDCIARALAETGGNITRAAGLLGMKRPRLSQLVKQYGLGSASSGAEAEGEAEEVE